MAPRKSIPNVNEMKVLFARLDDQARTQEQILWQLKGNPELEIEGLIPAVKSLRSELHDIKAWRNEQTLLKGKVDFKRFFASLGVAWKFAAWVAGIGGGTYGVFAIIKSVFE